MNNDMKIKFSADLADIDMPPGFDASGTAWNVKLWRYVDGKRRQFSTPFFTGSMVGEPDLETVWECLESDASIARDYDNSIDFAQDFGYANMADADPIFKAIKRQSKRFEKFVSA